MKSQREKICFVALENVYYLFHLFFSFSMEWPQWLLCIFLKSSRNIFLAPSIEKAQTKKKRLAY